ncbi:MAG: hypothetical protein WBD20_23410 [Pirellulaceae bacterium]
MAEEKSQIDTLKDAIVDENKKLGEEVPGAPFALVGLSYIVILGIALAGMGLFFWLR